MPKLDSFPTDSDSSDHRSLTPPAIITRAGQDAVRIYAALHTTFANAQNDQFSVGVSDFLESLEDSVPGIRLQHIVEENIVTHLERLAAAGYPPH